MDVLYLLIPISLIFVAIVAWVFIWSVKSGQYDDMEGPAHEILMDNDAIQPAEEDKQSPAHNKAQTNAEENQNH